MILIKLLVLTILLTVNIYVNTLKNQRPSTAIYSTVPSAANDEQSIHESKYQIVNVNVDAGFTIHRRPKEENLKNGVNACVNTEKR